MLQLAPRGEIAVPILKLEAPARRMSRDTWGRASSRCTSAHWIDY